MDPNMRPQGNTGPKAVILDAADAAKKSKEKLDAAQEEAVAAAHRLSVIKDDDDDEEKDERLDKIREQRRERRIKEIAESKKSRVFGKLMKIGVSQYVDSIDNEQPDIYVVIHLFQPHVKACASLTKILSDLAAKHKHVKFQEILSTEAKADFDDVALPALLVYKAGDLVSSHVAIAKDFGEDFGEGDITTLLEKDGVLADPLN